MGETKIGGKSKMLEEILSNWSEGWKGETYLGITNLIF